MESRLNSIKDRFTPKVARISALLVSCLFVLISFSSSLRKSITPDEPIIVVSGLHYLNNISNELNPENPPFAKSLLALPLLMQDHKTEFPESLRYTYNMDDELKYADDYVYLLNKNNNLLKYPRLVNIIITLVASLFIYLIIKTFACELFAFAGFTIFLMAPTVIAHSRLATVDMAVTAFSMGSMYFLILSLKKNKYWSVASGVMLGLAMLSKYTGILFFPLIIIQLICYTFYNFSRKRLIKVAFIILSISISMLITINLFYKFEGFGNSLSDNQYKSKMVTRFSSTPVVGKLPLPLPDDYIRGFDIAAYNNSAGYPNVFLGKGYPGGGSWWYYYIVVSLIKIPIPILVLAFTGTVFSLIQYRKKWILYILLLPPLILFLNFSFFASRQLGIRYLLPCFPYLAIASALGLRLILKTRKLPGNILLVALLTTWIALESVIIYPDYISYFNQFAGGPEGGKDILAMSNIDWGQDLIGLKEWIVSSGNPEIYYFYANKNKTDYYGITQSQAPEYIAVGVTDMYRYKNHPYVSRLLKTEPVTNIGYSIYIYKKLTKQPSE